MYLANLLTEVQLTIALQYFTNVRDVIDEVYSSLAGLASSMTFNFYPAAPTEISKEAMRLNAIGGFLNIAFALGGAFAPLLAVGGPAADLVIRLLLLQIREPGDVTLGNTAQLEG